MINSPADKLLSCATLITGQLGSQTFSGTGFVFNFNIKDQRVPFLVRNHPVLNDFDTLQIYIRTSLEENPDPSASGKRVTVNFNRNSADVFFHPNPNIDLAVIPLAPLFNQLSEEQEHILNFFIQESMIVLESDYNTLSAIENLVMPGCPMGIYDDTNFLPVLRRGITASHPAYSFKGASEFLSDISCFPGSSGSPIFLYNPFGYPDYQNMHYHFGTSRIRLLGIQCRSYTNTSTGESLNLAVAQQARFLLDFKPILENFV